MGTAVFKVFIGYILSAITVFTLTAEIHARSLAKFYGQYADRHINLKFMRASANESGKFDNLLS